MSGAEGRENVGRHFRKQNSSFAWMRSPVDLPIHSGEPQAQPHWVEGPLVMCFVGGGSVWWLKFLVSYLRSRV